MTNRVQRADFGTLAKLCRFFHVKPGDLLDYEEGEESNEGNE
jgi:DNA-binding Xre family transcriptional regulator